jgi:hypothetical protein
LPDDDLFCSRIGSRKEHVVRRGTSGGLGRGLLRDMEGPAETGVFDIDV